MEWGVEEIVKVLEGSNVEVEQADETRHRLQVKRGRNPGAHKPSYWIVACSRRLEVSLRGQSPRPPSRSARASETREVGAGSRLVT